MAQGIISYDTAWGIGTETTFGTPVVPTVFIPFMSESINKEHGVLELTNTQARQQQEFIGATEKHLGRVSVGGDVQFHIEPIGFGMVLKHALGSETVTDVDGAGSEPVYDHEFKVADTLPIFSSQLKLSSGKAKRVTSAMIDQLSVDFAEELLTGSASLKARDMDIIASPAAPSYPTQRPYSYTDASFSLSGTDVTGQITNGSLQLSNNVVDDDYRQGSSLLAGLYAGTLTVEGSFEVVYDPALGTGDDFYAWVEEKAAKDLEIVYSGNAISGADTEKFTLTLKVPRAIVTASSPQISAGELVKRTVAFRAFYDVTAADKGISAVLRNARSTAY